MRRRRRISLTQPGGSTPLPRRRRALLRRHPRRAPRSGRRGAAPSGRPAGRSSCRPGGTATAGSRSSTYPVADTLGLGAGGAETIVVMRDVTEARHREAVRETFIGVLSHELRTPVTTIFGGAKLLAREPSTLDEETKRGIFRDIHDEAERLQRLVEDVVALNRFGDGSGEIGWEPVLLQRLVPRVVASEQGRWPGVTFVLEIAPGSADRSSADPTYVEQVVRNLLSNAAKYGGAGSTVTRRRRKRGERRGRRPDPRRRPGLPGGRDEPAVRAVLPVAGNGRDGERRRDRPVRVRPADRRDGRPDLGGAAARAAAPSSGSRCRSSTSRRRDPGSDPAAAAGPRPGSRRRRRPSPR